MSIHLYRYTVSKLKRISEKVKTLSMKIKTFRLTRQMMSNLFLIVKKKETKHFNQTKNRVEIKKITKRKEMQMQMELKQQRE